MDRKKEKQWEMAPRSIEDFLSPREPIPKSLYVILTLSSFAFFLVIWSILTYGGFIDPLFLPSPGRVFQAGWDLFAEFSFTTDIFNSVYRVMVGFIVAAVLGVPIGLIMGTFKAAEAITEPVVGFIRYMPASAFIPLFILWLGIGDIEKIAIIFVGSFFQLCLIVTELVASASGIGYMIISSQRMLRTGNIIFGILTIGMLGLITDYFSKWLYNRLFPWVE